MYLVGFGEIFPGWLGITRARISLKKFNVKSR
jgi:hypothetical protein